MSDPTPPAKVVRALMDAGISAEMAEQAYQQLLATLPLESTSIPVPQVVCLRAHLTERYHRMAAWRA